MWQGLFGNLAVVALVISAWVHAQYWLKTRARIARHAVMGLMLGFGAIASMIMSVRLDNGLVIDLRTSLVALAGLFGGPIAALISSAIAASFRLVLGGEGAIAGALGILLASATGLAGFAVFGRGGPSCPQALLVSVATALTPLLASAAVPAAVAADALAHYGLVFVLLKIAVTFGASCLLLQGLLMNEERGLLRAALAQAPDFLYVKNARSQFVAVNEAVARHNGFDHPAQMHGKTDFDLEPDRAQELFEAEQELIRSGRPIVDREEALIGAQGRPQWFLTSKTPIRNPDGEILGLAGVTRDITDRKRLDTELTESRNQLSYVLTEMSDGLALFDRDGTLVFCNERYRACFPLTAASRVPGASIRDILSAVAVAGEQVGIAGDNIEGWIDAIAGSLHLESEQEINLADGRWMQIRTRPTRDGWSVVVVSEITNLKQAEVALQGLADQLKLLASTDSLTGLMNRRAFDEALDLELARSAREAQPISLLMVDVDRFKAYNDIYGHPVGDQCLRALGTALNDVLRRPGDLGARYGGEEFVAILPNTDDDGAFAVAENLRHVLGRLAMPHEGSDKKVVTVSIGIACYGAGETRRRASELIVRADDALYSAKEAGRDRIAGWRARHPVRSPMKATGT